MLCYVEVNWIIIFFRIKIFNASVSASSPSSQISYAKVLKTNDGNERSNNASTSSSSLPSHLQLPKPKRELYDKSKIQVGWNLTQKFGPGSGFNNVGNTCYLNSALQAFLHVPAIAQWLLNDQEHRDKCCKGRNNIHINVAIIKNC